MTFATVAALAVATLVALPIVAHLLRRRRSEEHAFAPVALVPASPPAARQRKRVDDRALFGVRLLAVLALALLGATPFVRCAGLSLDRRGGAALALALVVDDSLSMTARAGDRTRWDRAVAGARELVSGAQDGDELAIVLAGAPARLALAPTTDRDAALAALARLAVSHRATDLEGALAIARAALRPLPQVDKRVVLLSDLADGHAEDAPLASADGVPTWTPLVDLAAPGKDCAVVTATRKRDRVVARIVCAPAEAASFRVVTLRAADGHAISTATLASATASADVQLDAKDAAEGAVVALAPGDDIVADDEAPVLAARAALSVAVVADAASHKLATGGAPPVEQALAALELDAEIHPLPVVPDREGDLVGVDALILDDPPGLGPEARRALATWLEGGGVALVTLGPRSATAQLGSTLAPFLSGAVAWGPSPVNGIGTGVAGVVGVAAAGLDDLRPRGRATADFGVAGGALRVLARWKDDAPWLVERAMGRGVAASLTLPTSLDESDLALRPAFLALLDHVVGEARARSGARRSDVGATWAFDDARRVDAKGPGGQPVAVVDELGRKLVVPALAGAYSIRVDDRTETRIAAVVERESDLRPRRVEAPPMGQVTGDTRTAIDLSRPLAFVLLALFVAEIALRARAQRQAHAAAAAVVRATV